MRGKVTKAEIIRIPNWDQERAHRAHEAAPIGSTITAASCWQLAFRRVLYCWRHWYLLEAPSPSLFLSPLHPPVPSARLDRVGLLGNNYTAIRCSDHRDDRRTRQIDRVQFSARCSGHIWPLADKKWPTRCVCECVCVWPVNIFPSVSIIVNRASVSSSAGREAATK